MKKIGFILMIMMMVLLTGCGKVSDKEIKNKFIKAVNNLNSYYMEGTLKLTNNDDTYHYDVEVSYQKDDKFKILLENKANSYQQIIVKNSSGVYVINPSLNKSFKFQSNWPGENSQAYLLLSVKNDLEKDDAYQFEQENDTYVFTTKVNYPNTKDLQKQRIILDKNYNLKKVEVMTQENIPKIVFEVTKYDAKANFNDDHFEVNAISDDRNSQNTEDKTENKQEANKEEGNNQETNKQQSNNNTNIQSNNSNEENRDNSCQDNSCSTKETMQIEEALFPLYLPENTSLSQKEVIDTENGQRVIMTFKGDNPFILVQETVAKEDELTIIPTYGEPYLLIDTVGSLTDVSYTWTSNGIEYYIVSDVMSQAELLEVAKSINVVSAINEK